MIKPGEEILVGNSGRFRVLDVVPFEEEDELPSIGLLQVEAARPHTRSLLCNGHEWQQKEGDLHGHCQGARSRAARQAAVNPCSLGLPVAPRQPSFSGVPH
jgi:hypothetical protein